MKLRQNISTKTKLSQTMRGWLPILQADLESLKETLDEASKENPFVLIKSGHERVGKRGVYEGFGRGKNAISDEIEALTTSKKSLYDRLYEQIIPPLFPTEKSKKIAYEIISYINEQGYFEADPAEVAAKMGIDLIQFEKIRARFAYLEPSGVGAVDLLESFLFQLNEFDLDDELYRLTVKMIRDFESLEQYRKNPRFNEALRVIRKFKNPPAIHYQKEQVQIIPDIFIEEKEGEIRVSLNEAYYPEIVIDKGGMDEGFDFVKQKIKEAKSLIDALDMRKATLQKIALMLVEYQYEFFKGGPIRPMKLDDLAGELGRHHSTISRAISNKYLSCDRGVFAIKSFFATALSEESDTSNAEIKEFIKEVIRHEDRKKPLSDNKILALVEEKFGLKLGRRTITKYRMQANIASSSERKRLYTLCV